MDVELTEKEGKFVLNLDVMEQKIKDGTIAIVRQEMKDAIEAEKKKIFVDSEANEAQLKDGSIIDTSFFNRKYYESRIGGRQMSGAEMAQTLVASGGPFLKLGKAMNTFADFVKMGLQCKFDLNLMMTRKFSIDAYNQEISEWNRKFATAAGLTTVDAGAIVPVDYVATVIEFAIQTSQILPRLWRIPLATMQTQIPTLYQTAGSYFGGIMLYHPTEAQELWATKPAFSYKQLIAHKLIGLIPLTDELVMDSNINIINYITGLFTRAFAWQTEFEVLQGNGLLKQQFMGVVHDPAVRTNMVTRTTANALKRADVLALESIIDENIQSLIYITRRASLNNMRQELTAGSTPLYYDTTVQGLSERMGPSLNGYPCILTRNAPALIHEGDLICGDFGYYLWGVRQDMTIDLSKERYFEFDLTALRFVMRQDGMAGVPLAFSYTSGPAQS
jgi:HK97 family phage major capsid protein